MLRNPLAAADEQRIDIRVLDAANGQPLQDIEAELRIGLPDGSSESQSFPTTDASGNASLVLPALKKVSNGTIVTWQVCLKVNEICQTGNYLIWSNP